MSVMTRRTFASLIASPTFAQTNISPALSAAPNFCSHEHWGSIESDRHVSRRIPCRYRARRAADTEYFIVRSPDRALPARCPHFVRCRSKCPYTAGGMERILCIAVCPSPISVQRHLPVHSSRNLVFVRNRYLGSGRRHAHPPGWSYRAQLQVSFRLVSEIDGESQFQRTHKAGSP